MKTALEEMKSVQDAAARLDEREHHKAVLRLSTAEFLVAAPHSLDVALRRELTAMYLTEKREKAVGVAITRHKIGSEKKLIDAVTTRMGVSVMIVIWRESGLINPEVLDDASYQREFLDKSMNKNSLAVHMAPSAAEKDKFYRAICRIVDAMEAIGLIDRLSGPGREKQIVGRPALHEILSKCMDEAGECISNLVDGEGE